MRFYGIADEHDTLLSLPKGARRGTTFTDYPFPVGEFPKLFKTKRGAMQARDLWRKGRLERSYGHDWEDLTVVPVEGRSAASVRVVEVDVKIRKPRANQAPL